MYASYHQSVTPDEAAATGLLQHLNKDELQRILDDDQKLEDLIKDLSQVQYILIIHSDFQILEYTVHIQDIICI